MPSFGSSEILASVLNPIRQDLRQMGFDIRQNSIALEKFPLV